MRTFLTFIIIVVVIIGAVFVYQKTSETKLDQVPEQQETKEQQNTVENEAEMEIISKVEAYIKTSQEIGEDVELTFTISEETWSDACLGIQEAGQMCAQVITPGYKVIVESPDNTYVYRTDAKAETIILDQTK